jgi:hypothetical protein
MNTFPSLRTIAMAALVAATAGTTPLPGKPIAPKDFPHVYDQEFAMSSYKPTYKTYAQFLVDQLPLKYPDLEYGLIHALLPNGTEHAVIASHRPAQVGALDILGDNEIADNQLIEINPRMREGFSRTVIILPMKNSKGEYIRASWALYFYTYPTDDIRKVFAKAIEIRDELAKEVPDVASLYKPAP